MPPRGLHDVIQRRPLQSQWLTSFHAARITILRKSRRRKRHGSGSHGSARYGGHEMITHIPSPECASFPKLLIFLRCRASGGGLIPPPCVRNSYSACLCIIMVMVNIVPQLIRSIRCRNRAVALGRMPSPCFACFSRSEEHTSTEERRGGDGW